MATLKKRRANWYARIREWDGMHEREIQIPLRTTSKVTALERLAEVNRVEADIRQGIKFDFPWITEEGGPVKVARLTMEQAYAKYTKAKKIDGLRSSTLERSRYAMKSLYQVIGRSLPLGTIRTNHMDQYKAYWFGRHDITTVNINLSKIGAFFRWCSEYGYMSKIPNISKIKDIPKPISYISDAEFKMLMETETVDNYYKRVFLFYRETGCRLSEPFYADIERNWLLITPDRAKSKRSREVELTDILLMIYNEMKEDWSTKKLRPGHKKSMGILKPRSIMDRYSKVFKKACIEIGLENRKFHNLRDTFAIRLWAVTGDIFYVSKVIGHSSVTMTEKYANFNLRRLRKDFPSLEEQIDERLKTEKFGFRDTDFRDTNGSLMPFLEGKAVA